MIAQALVNDVRRLLAEGHLSQRKIARVLGVSRGTVGAIATGRRPDFGRLHGATEEEEFAPTGPPARCPGCGGMVYMPCRLCRARARRATRLPVPRLPWPTLEKLLGLNLKEEHRQRYEQVRARRMKTESSA
jgi:transcriptional regulator with XRE-family HTH domain